MQALSFILYLARRLHIKAAIYNVIVVGIMNTYLKYKPAGVQFIAFFLIAAGFFIINTLLNFWFFSDVSTVLTNSTSAISTEMVTTFKWAQLASATLAFIVPALLFGYFSAPDALPYVGLQKHISPLLLLVSITLLVCVQPFVGYLGTLNGKINFGSLQKTFQESEAMYNRAIAAFLRMDTPVDLMINLFIMALLPAIGEELFFRGALQRVMLRLSNRPWLSILVSAGIFAMLHGTVFKLVPIFVLGLLLGTIYHITRNLWYGITIHFVNNAFAVLSVYYASKSTILKKLSDDAYSIPIYMAALSLAITIALVYFIRKKSDEIFPGELNSEANEYIA